MKTLRAVCQGFKRPDQRRHPAARAVSLRAMLPLLMLCAQSAWADVSWVAVKDIQSSELMSDAEGVCKRFAPSAALTLYLQVTENLTTAVWYFCGSDEVLQTCAQVLASGQERAYFRAKIAASDASSERSVFSVEGCSLSEGAG